MLDRLIALDEKGFIKSPAESVDDFIKRAEFTDKLENHMAKEFARQGFVEFGSVRFSKDERVPAEIIDKCLSRVRDHYRIEAGWIPTFFSSNLGPFWGGQALGFQDSEGEIEKDTPFVIVQLRDSFREKEQFLIYKRDEIVSHEACHIARMLMEQDIYEEPLAYLLSDSKFRRYLGPVLRSFKDFWILTVVYLLFMAVHFMAWLIELPVWLFWSSKVPLVLFGVFLGVRNHRVYKRLFRAIGTLGSVFGENAEAVAFRCTDNEIDEIASMKADGDLEGLLRGKMEEDVRWQVIFNRFG